jgi:hypothetical protein
MQLRRLLLLTCFVGVLTAQASEREFRSIVRAISAEYNTNPRHIPFFGLVNVVTFFVKPAGAKHIDLAVFDNLGDCSRAGGDLNIAIRHAIGPGWNPLLRTRSRRHGDEQFVYIYTRPQGKDWRFLLTTIERDNATVVDLTLDPKAAERWFADPSGSLGIFKGDGRSSTRRSFEP